MRKRYEGLPHTAIFAYEDERDFTRRDDFCINNIGIDIATGSCLGGMAPILCILQHVRESFPCHWWWRFNLVSSCRMSISLMNPIQKWKSILFNFLNCTKFPSLNPVFKNFIHPQTSKQSVCWTEYYENKLILPPAQCYWVEKSFGKG